MDKPALASALMEIYKTHTMWNKRIDIAGEEYIYISATNEFRKVINQPSGEILKPVAFPMFGRIKWIVD